MWLVFIKDTSFSIISAVVEVKFRVVNISFFRRNTTFAPSKKKSELQYEY